MSRLAAATNELGDVLRRLWYPLAIGTAIAALVALVGVLKREPPIDALGLVAALAALAAGIGLAQVCLLLFAYVGTGVASVLAPAATGSLFALLAYGAVAAWCAAVGGAGLAAPVVYPGVCLLLALTWRAYRRAEARLLRPLEQLVVAAVEPVLPASPAAEEGDSSLAGPLRLVMPLATMRVARSFNGALHGRSVRVEAGLLHYTFLVPAGTWRARMARGTYRLLTRGREALSWSSRTWAVVAAVDDELAAGTPLLHVRHRGRREIMTPFVELRHMRFESVVVDDRLSVETDAPGLDWWRVFSPPLLEALATATEEGRVEVFVVERRLLVVAPGRAPSEHAVRTMLELTVSLHAELDRVFAPAPR